MYKFYNGAFEIYIPYMDSDDAKYFILSGVHCNGAIHSPLQRLLSEFF